MALPVVPNLNLNIGWKALLVVFGFFAFSIVLVVLGLAAVTDSLSMILGAFMVTVLVAAAFMGKLSFNSPVLWIGLIIAGFLLTVNPMEEFTIGTILPDIEQKIAHILEVKM